MNVRSTVVPFRFTPIILVFSAFFGFTLRAGDAAPADISFKIVPGQSYKYVCNTETTSDIRGSEANQPFALKTELKLDITIGLQGLLRKEPGMGVSLRVTNYSKLEKQFVGNEVNETHSENGKIKVTQNGKAIVDSDNDIGLEQIKVFQQFNKYLQTGEMRVVLDAAGKSTGETEGDGFVIDTVRASGAEGILRLAAGKSLKPGESWEDSQMLPYLASFKLAKSVVARSKSTFVGWETKYDKKLAKLEIVTAWEKGDLKGENEEGMQAEVSKLEGASIGIAYFDPAEARFVEGELELTSKYHINGTAKDGRTTGLDVVTKTKFNFRQTP